MDVEHFSILDIFLSAGYNLLMFLRVLPSGKAVASQATIRGFESHHPLIRPAFRAGFLLRVVYEIIANCYKLATFILEFLPPSMLK